MNGGRPKPFLYQQFLNFLTAIILAIGAVSLAYLIFGRGGNGTSMREEPGEGNYPWFGVSRTAPPFVPADVIEIVSTHSYVTEYGNLHIVGEVRNKGEKTVRWVEVNARLHDPQGVLLCSENGYTEPSDLRPGETASFKCIFTEAPVYRKSTRYTVTVTGGSH